MKKIYFIVFLLITSLSAFSQKSQDSLLINSINELALQSKKSLEEAKVVLDICDSIVKHTDSRRERYFYFNLLGSIYGDQGFLEISTRYYFEALNDAEELNDSSFLATLHFNLGLNMSDMEHSNQALEYYYKAQSYMASEVDTFFQVSVYRSMLTELQKQEKIESADSLIEVISRNKLFKGETPYQLVLPQMLYRIAKRKEYSRADFIIVDSIGNLIDTSNYLLAMDYSEVYDVKANLYINLGKYDSALVYYNKIDSVLKRNGRMLLVAYNIQEALKIHDSLGSSAEIKFRLLKESQLIKDSLLGGSSNESLTKQFMDYELDQIRKRKDTELQLEKSEIEILKNKNVIYSGLIILAVVVLIALIFIYISYKRNSELKIKSVENERLLIHKNNEIVSIAFNNLNNNKILKDLKSSLDQAMNSEHPKDELRKIRNQLNYTLSLLDSEKNTINQIDSIKDHFLFLLEEAHPDLTRLERELCVLLRSGLSSKEIAEVRQIHPKSVEKSRSRLRKKLNLDSSTSFVDYFKRLN